MSVDGNSIHSACFHRDEPDNDSIYDSDHDNVERVCKDLPVRMADIFGEDSDNDDNDDTQVTGPRLLEKKYMINDTIVNGKGVEMKLKSITLVLREEDESEKNNVLMTFIDLVAVRKLCKSVLKAGDDTDFNDNIVRSVTRSAVAPILEIPVKNNKKASTKLVIVSVKDVIDYILSHLLKPWVKNSDNVESMMNSLETLKYPTLRYDCVTPLTNNHIINNQSLIVNDMVICGSNFLSLELP